MSKVIRDFIYVDSERLKSLYSQVFEGIAEKIIDSFSDKTSSKESQKGKIFKGEELVENVSESIQRTEDKILFDHLYNRFEKEIENILVDPKKDRKSTL